MSNKDRETALDYRARAKELRALAADFANQTAKRDLIELADRWDEMAADLERRASHPSLFPDLLDPQRKAGE